MRTGHQRYDPKKRRGSAIGGFLAYEPTYPLKRAIIVCVFEHLRQWVRASRALGAGHHCLERHRGEKEGDLRRDLPS